MTPELCCIVSTFEGADKLKCSLAALRLQNPPVRILVTDNSPETGYHALGTEMSTKRFDAEYINTSTVNGGTDPCDAANWVCQSWPFDIREEWLTFPSDDGYHVPLFSKIVLQTAAEHPEWDFIYWDILYDPRRTGKYEVISVHPANCHIDKTSFMIRTKLFCEIGGFPPSPDNGWRDAKLAEKLMAMKVKHGKAPGVLVCHN